LVLTVPQWDQRLPAAARDHVFHDDAGRHAAGHDTHHRRSVGQLLFGNYHLMDHELMGGDARHAIIAEDEKREG